MEEIAEILSIEKKTMRLAILAPASGGCEKCAIHGLCKPEDSKRIIELPRKEGFQPSDHVKLTLREGNNILNAFILFIGPVICLIAGYMIARPHLTEGFSILVGIGFMMIYLIPVHFLEKFLLRGFRIERL